MIARRKPGRFIAERYWRGGSLVVEGPPLPLALPRARVTRDGRCLALEVWLQDALYVSVSVYRSWGMER